MSERPTERADVVVVGARCAGSAAAIALARAGRRVVVLDRVSFPADTISTHLLFPSGVAELARLGALERVRALGAPPLPTALVAGAGVSPSAAFSEADGLPAFQHEAVTFRQQHAPSSWRLRTPFRGSFDVTRTS